MSKVYSDKAIARREARAVCGGIKAEEFNASSGLSVEILNKLDSAHAEYVSAYNALDGAEEAVKWQRWFSIARVWEGFKAVNKTAKQSDLEKYFLSAPASSLATMIKCGNDVTITRGEDGKQVVDIPRDINGNAFTTSKYSQIYKHRARIADGYFLATDTASELKNKVKLLNGVVETAGEAEAETAGEAETETAREAGEVSALEVFINGEAVTLNEEQARAILAILNIELDTDGDDE